VYVLSLILTCTLDCT